jgi:hypothetical protein
MSSHFCNSPFASGKGKLSDRYQASYHPDKDPHCTIDTSAITLQRATYLHANSTYSYANRFSSPLSSTESLCRIQASINACQLKPSASNSGEHRASNCNVIRVITFGLRCKHPNAAGCSQPIPVGPASQIDGYPAIGRFYSAGTFHEPE